MTVDLSEQARILAPLGRDADVAARMLAEANVVSRICRDVPELCRELARGAGFAVVTEEALASSDMHDLSARIEAQPEWLEKGRDRFQIVFSDVVMPGMSGIELASEVRQRYADISIVLASGYSHVLAQSGTHGFKLLHKPYSVEQLSQVLQKSLGANRAAVARPKGAAASHVDA